MTRFTRVQDRFFDRVRSPKAAVAAAKPGTASDLSALEGHDYALLVTFKRDGSPVPTPVWFGLADGRLYVNTSVDTHKVKRIRNDPHVRVGPSTMRGKAIGPLTEGRARLLTAPEERDRAEAAIAANYGKTRVVYERVGERMGVETVYIEVTPEGGAA